VTSNHAPSKPPVALAFEIPQDVRDAVRDAKAAFDATIASTHMAAHKSTDFSGALLKQTNLSPDGAMQMSFQLAYALMHGPGPLPSTYESASTAAFKHGRTETIRSASNEAAAFTRAFTDAKSPPSERAALMRAAINNHSKLTRDALMGKGMDRHLFGLQYVAQLQGRTHPLFECAASRKLKHILISTSTLNSEALSNGGFGPVNQDCFAVGYGIRSYGSEARVMTYGGAAQQYAECLGEAMEMMREASLHGAK